MTTNAISSPVPSTMSDRIVGLDLARSLAIMGMFWAHMTAYEPAGFFDGWLAQVPDGRSAITFALLAGVSVALMTGRQNPYVGERMYTARLRIVGRALVLFLAGGLLSSLGTSVVIILGFYGFWLLLALPFTHLSVRTLVWVAGVGAFAGPFLLILTKSAMAAGGLFVGSDPNSAFMTVMITGTYPGLQYGVFVIAGLAIGRCDMLAQARQLRLIAGGLVLMVGGYGLAYVATGGENTWPQHMPWDPLTSLLARDAAPRSLEGPLGWVFPSLGEFFSAEPHSATILETVGSGGFAITLLGVCLLIGSAVRYVLYPLAAMGSMPLTSYCGHVVAIYFFPDLEQSLSLTGFFVVLLTTMVFASIWKAMFSRGPLEWVAWRSGLLYSR
ncbi:DUF418 domain-containing protein [Arcanobacterium phocisimile]|uniref:DUF418 domain-containing protein n=1 Tax=Arcanobacterium phocisimile TaxID=1302235 RepID=A0ABX7IIM2_9ACTO|nr:DUF418 domain-containing protein [Arcanobacterium phocisimile]QRV02279.1 DUF418 domain-containing protein [Arcanobacterium phocisimile]